MERTFVVGDVHGCLDELQSLLRQGGVARGDRVALAGDLVGKGPDSHGVVQLVREMGALAVLGNHDPTALSCGTGVSRVRLGGRAAGCSTSWTRQIGPSWRACRCFCGSVGNTKESLKSPWCMPALSGRPP